MYNRAFIISLFMTFILAMSSCGNSTAQKEYEQESQKLEQMKEDNRHKIRQAIATGASEPEVLMLRIKCSEEEMQQADKVEQLAKEAGIDE